MNRFTGEVMALGILFRLVSTQDTDLSTPLIKGVSGHGAAKGSGTTGNSDDLVT
jgi:hypothetical protein